MTATRTKRVMYKLMLSVATLFVVMVVLEGVLRLAGWAMVRFAVNDQSVQGQGPVVLCIGDSFTMGGLSTFDSSYPVQLGELFRERHPEAGVRIVNLGRAGSNTAQMLSNLKRGIAEHHPDAVAVLGGWNNFRNFYGFRQPGETGGLGRFLTDFILDLRVYKMALMTSERLRGIGPKPLENTEVERWDAAARMERARRLTSDSSGHLEQGMAFKEAGDPDRAIGCFVASIEANPTDPRGYRQVAKTIRDPEAARRFFTARATEHPDQEWPLIGLSLVHQDQGRLDDARDSLERVRSTDSAINQYIEHSLRLLDRDQARAEIASWIQLDLTDMDSLCQAHGAQLVIQTYPLGDFSLLVRFADREGLPLADHLAVFNEIPAPDREQHFLPEDFHPNAKGNRLMAENLYRTLIEMRLLRKDDSNDA